MSHFDHFGGFKRQPKMVEAGDSAVLILKCDSHYHLRYCRTPPRQIEQVQFTFFFQLPSFFGRCYVWRWRLPKSWGQIMQVIRPYLNHL